MAKPLLVYRNLADAATVTADDEVTTLPAAFLQQPQLGQVWRTPDATTSSAVVVDLGASTTISAVALLNVNLSAAGDARIKLSDTNGTGDADVHDSGALSPAGVDPFYKALIYVLASDLAARWVRIELDDDSLDYLEAGRVVVGPAWRMAHGHSRAGHERFGVDDSLVDRSLDGSSWVESLPVRRGIRANFEGVTVAEQRLHLDALARVAGRHSDVLLCLDHEASNIGQESFWGLMPAAPVMRQRGFETWAASLEIVGR